MREFDVIVIGGGPAGLAAAIAAKRENASVLLVEREARLGGILKQCIHDGFGLVRFNEKLSGPEYAERFIDEFEKEKLEAKLLTFVTKAEKCEGGYRIVTVSRNGIEELKARAIVLATGCRERTAKQVAIHGTRPAGVFTAGTAQHFVNLLGVMPTKKCVVLGSGDIGLIMARRLTLEGAKVVGVYEAKSTPSGLTRNIHQCLHDFGIPLYLSKTVTRVFGDDRLTAVEISDVDERMKPIAGTAKIVDCDALILSVGLIPENELAESLNVRLDGRTKGAVCDGQLETTESGIFSCGNALHVNDLVDYVSESGETAGKNAAHYAESDGRFVELSVARELLYFVPQRIALNKRNNGVICYFRSAAVRDKSRLTIKKNGEEVFSKVYAFLRPPEMERLLLNFDDMKLSENDKLEINLEEAAK